MTRSISSQLAESSESEEAKGVYGFEFRTKGHFARLAEPALVLEVDLRRNVVADLFFDWRKHGKRAKHYPRPLQHDRI